MSSKNFWGKLRNWQRGGVVGLLFGIAIQFANVNYLHTVPILAATKILPAGVKIWIALWYTVFGTLAGFIFERAKNKFSNKDPVTILILVVLATIFLLIFLSSLGLTMMTSGLG